MTILEITKTEDIAESIKILKDGKDNAAYISKLKTQYNIEGHDTLSKVKRPDKPIYKEENGKEVLDRWQPVNRVAFPIQKRIVKSSVSFAFGNEVKLNCEPKNDSEKTVLDIVKRVFYDNKIDSFNRKIATNLFCSTEVAEFWYVETKEKHLSYGFETPLKLRVFSSSPWGGDSFYPYFDDETKGDLVAFSREYKVKKDNKEVEHFDVYTDNEFASYVNLDGKWQELKAKSVNPIGKIPVIFATQEQAEWEDIQNAIDRLEELLSNFGETNNYHAAPKIFVQGKLINMIQKGDSGGIIEGESGATASYLSWNHATDAVKLEIEQLMKFIYSLTQTPDISFENLKDLNQISGVALQMLFMDAHLKVQEKREILDTYLQRRINVVLAFIPSLEPKLKTACQTIEIRPEITPYIINDLKTQVDILTTANGAKPLISQKSAMEQLGIVKDVEAEWKQIEAEAAQENQTAIGSTVI